MGMEVGIDKKQIDALRNMWTRWCGDPVQLRFMFVLLLLAIGIFGVNKSMAEALGEARARHKKATSTAAMAEDVVFYRNEAARYEDRVAVPSDVASWQNYVLSTLSHTNAQLISIEPKKSAAKGPFKIIEMELVARGPDFNEFVDFINRLERGKRIMRFERLRVEKVQNSIGLTCTIKGMVKLGAYKPPVADDESTGESAVEPVAADDGTAPDADEPGSERPDEGSDEAVSEGGGALPDPADPPEDRPSAGSSAGSPDLEASSEAPAADEEP